MDKYWFVSPGKAQFHFFLLYRKLNQCNYPQTWIVTGPGNLAKTYENISIVENEDKSLDWRKKKEISVFKGVSGRTWALSLRMGKREDSSSGEQLPSCWSAVSWAPALCTSGESWHSNINLLSWSTFLGAMRRRMWVFPFLLTERQKCEK